MSPVPNLGKTTRSPQSDLTPWILTLHLGAFDGLTTSHEIGHILGAQHGNKPNILFFARGYQTKSGEQ